MKYEILLVDPMLGTGGSASMAVKVLKQYGVEETNILFLNIVGCEVGLKKLQTECPGIKIITT